MNEPVVLIRLDDNGRVYRPGETLSGEYRVESLAADEVKAIELSVLWYTEGKGDEDMAVHEFKRLARDDGDWIDLHRPSRFSTTLPRQPAELRRRHSQDPLVRSRSRVSAAGQGGARRAAVRPGRRPRRRGGPAVSDCLHPTPSPRAACGPGPSRTASPKASTPRPSLARLRENGWRGEIVGPHGSGKSALLATLIPAIEHSGKRVASVELHDGQRRLPVAPARTPGLDASTVLVIDGFEQLSLANRFRIKRFTRRPRRRAAGRGARPGRAAAALDHVDRPRTRPANRPSASGRERAADCAGGRGRGVFAPRGQPARDAVRVVRSVRVAPRMTSTETRCG